MKSLHRVFLRRVCLNLSKPFDLLRHFYPVTVFSSFLLDNWTKTKMQGLIERPRESVFCQCLPTFFWIAGMLAVVFGVLHGFLATLHPAEEDSPCSSVEKISFGAGLLLLGVFSFTNKVFNYNLHFCKNINYIFQQSKKPTKSNWYLKAT